MDASNLIKPALASGELRCIGSTTHEEYRAASRSDRALARRFQKIDVLEPTVEETVEYPARASRSTTRSTTRSPTPTRRCASAAELSTSTSTSSQAADKAIDVIDEAGARSACQAALRDTNTIDVPQISRRSSPDRAHPRHQRQADDKDKLRTSSRTLKDNVFGQDDAIEAVVPGRQAQPRRAHAPGQARGQLPVRRPHRRGQDRGRPPARPRPGHRAPPLRHVRVHGAPRREPAHRAPPGYVGFDQGGLLTEAIRKNPTRCCCSTRSRRPTRTCSTCCCRSWTRPA